MSQRNPLNERYTTENRKGTTRKSAASAKPTSKAGASVQMESEQKKKKDPKAKRDAQRAQRTKQREIETVLDRKYYTPPTKEYKIAKRIWIALVVIAGICTVATFIVRERIPVGITTALLIVAYAALFGALILDFTVVRKARRKYQESVAGQINKDRAALQKAQKENERRIERGEEAISLFDAIEMPPERSRFSFKDAASAKDEAKATTDAILEAKDAEKAEAKAGAKKAKKTAQSAKDDAAE